MAKETFNRYEKKYLIDSAQRLELERELARHMSLDPYHVKETTYRILNLYYDTVDHRLIRHSLQKPKYKEKLRIRAYGVPTLDSYVYVEIKKKVKGIVNKRRTRMTLRDAYTMLQTREAPPHDAIHNEQVIHELLILLQQQALRPTTLLAYDRRAYTGIKESDLRITFDTNLQARRHYNGLEEGDYGALLLPESACLMEIKVRHAMPLWLSELLSSRQIYPTSFSKYGVEYLSYRATQVIGEPARIRLPGLQPSRQLITNHI